MDNNKVNVRVSEGKLIGIITENVYGAKYIAFRGIPYAKPPVGELRFKDPVPPEPWSGDRDASQYGNSAVQMDMFLNQIIGDEDCLYLNVFTTNIDSKKKRPVIVWIHGGGFYIGSGDATIYGPDHIVQKNVILVTLNYRLGILGFLNLYDKVATGNQGLKDVVMVLQWVQKNISNFGGDPKNITICGESAGGAIVHYLTISPLAEGLFHKAILQSGAATNPWAFTEREPPSMNKGFQLAEKLGKATTDAKVAYEFLKKIDAKKLIQTEQQNLLTEEQYHNSCSVKTVESRGHVWIPLHQPRAWLYSVIGVLRAMIQCEGRPDQVKTLKGTGKVVFRGKCRLATEDMTLRSDDTTRDIEIQTFLPEINITLLQEQEMRARANITLENLSVHREELIALKGRISEVSGSLEDSERNFFTRKQFIYPMATSGSVTVIVIAVIVYAIVKYKRKARVLPSAGTPVNEPRVIYSPRPILKRTASLHI